jgi:arginine/serine-rich splicing factor 7
LRSGKDACYRCGESGHIERNCKNPRKPRPSDSKDAAAKAAGDKDAGANKPADSKSDKPDAKPDAAMDVSAPARRRSGSRSHSPRRHSPRRSSPEKEKAPEPAAAASAAVGDSMSDK